MKKNVGRQKCIRVDYMRKTGTKKTKSMHLSAENV